MDYDWDLHFKRASLQDGVAKKGDADFGVGFGADAAALKPEPINPLSPMRIGIFLASAVVVTIVAVKIGDHIEKTGLERRKKLPYSAFNVHGYKPA